MGEGIVLWRDGRHGVPASLGVFHAPLAEVTCVPCRVTVSGTWNTPGLRAAGRGSATPTPVVTLSPVVTKPFRCVGSVVSLFEMVR